MTSILYTGLLGTSSPTNGDSGNTPRAAGHPEWSLPFWVVLTPTRTLYRCAGPPISAARLALPARSALPHLFLVSFGPPSKFPGDHWVTSDQNAPKCRHTSRGRLWSVSLTGGVSSHITKAGSRWDEEPLIRLGLMRPPYTRTRRSPAVLSPPQAVAPRAWSANASSHTICAGVRLSNA